MKTLVKSFITLYILIVNSVAIYGEEYINSNKSSLYVGKYLKVCGNVAAIKKLNKCTVLNIGRSYPNEDITFLIWDDNINVFNKKFSNINLLINHNVCASGTIEVYKNHLQIVVNNPNIIDIKK